MLYNINKKSDLTNNSSHSNQFYWFGFARYLWFCKNVNLDQFYWFKFSSNSNSNINHANKLEDLMDSLTNITFNNNIESNKYKQLSNKEEQEDQPKSKSNNLELFKLSWHLIPNKIHFILIILIIEIIGFIKTYSLTSKNKILVITTPLFSILLNIYMERYSFSILYKIKHYWKQTTMNFFRDLDWTDKNKQADMGDFNKMIDSASSALCNISTWGISTIIRGIFSFIQVVYILLIGGHFHIIIISGVTYLIFFQCFMKYHQNKMSEKRQEMKKIQKKNVPIKKWLLELFKQDLEEPDEIISLDKEFDNKENEFMNGYVLILYGISFISTLISWIGLFNIDNWSDFLLIKIVFDDLQNVIKCFSHFSNNLNMKSKDFDKYLEWYVGVKGRKEIVPQHAIKETGLIFNDIKIEYPKFKLETNKLELKPTESVLIRGPFGSGKTQLINSLIGNIFPSRIGFSKLTSANYTANWKYMSQMVRSQIPSGLTLREILKGETNNELIFKLIEVVGLGDKFSSLTSIDKPIEGFSGGQLMLLSLIFFLWSFIKDKQRILVLDEPEQGLDPESKIRVLKSLLEFLKKEIIYWNGGLEVIIVIIYHGEDDDIVELLSNGLFDKIWLFTKNQETTTVEQISEHANLFDYCQEILDKKQEKLNAIKKLNANWFRKSGLEK